MSAQHNEIPPVDVIWKAELWPEEWAAHILQTTPEMMQKYRQREGLPHTRLGRHIYYFRDSLVAWLRDHENTAP